MAEDWEGSYEVCLAWAMLELLPWKDSLLVLAVNECLLDADKVLFLWRAWSLLGSSRMFSSLPGPDCRFLSLRVTVYWASMSSKSE